MANYYEHEYVTEPKHCGKTHEHDQHRWHEMGRGFHVCTGNRSKP